MGMFGVVLLLLTLQAGKPVMMGPKFDFGPPHCMILGPWSTCDEPDVPAIKVNYTLNSAGCIMLAAGGCLETYTCEDKTRIYLMAEDGSRHCIKLPVKR